MSIRDERRAQAVERIADHILEHGLAGASLRPMAQAAGISDRMLLYYFADRSDVLETVLQAIAARMAGKLEQGIRVRVPVREFVPAMCEALLSDAMRPYTRLWLELAAAASRQEEPHRGIAQGIARHFLAWVESRIEVKGKQERARTAALVLAIVDGVAVLDAAGLSAEIDLQFLAKRL